MLSILALIFKKGSWLRHERLCPRMTFLKLFISITNYFLINLDIPHIFTEPYPLSYDMPYFGCPYPCPPMPMGFGWA
jgi:hypothetical protein